MSILTETQIVYSSAIDIDGALYTQHIIIKKILSCNNIEQELSDISTNSRSNPYIALHQAAMILKEALQWSTVIETRTLNPYDITFEKAKDVVPNFVTQFLEFL